MSSIFKRFPVNIFKEFYYYEKKTRKSKKLQARHIPKFEDIQQTPQSKPESYRELKETIQNGTRDEITEKAIAEANKE